jgi:hypothetical protein
LLLTGRSHNYERLEAITPEGIPGPRDVTQFLIGTGGRNLHANARPQLSIGEVLPTDVFGELGAYRARFVGRDGSPSIRATGPATRRRQCLGVSRSTRGREGGEIPSCGGGVVVREAEAGEAARVYGCG